MRKTLLKRLVYAMSAISAVAIVSVVLLNGPTGSVQAQPPEDLGELFDEITEEFERADKENLRIENKQETLESVVEEIVNTGEVPCDPGATTCTTVSFTIVEDFSAGNDGDFILVTLGGAAITAPVQNSATADILAPSGSTQTMTVACAQEITGTCTYDITINSGGTFTPSGTTNTSGVRLLAQTFSEDIIVN